MRALIYSASCAALLLSCGLAFGASGCPGKVPKGLSAVNLASRTVVNGLAMSISQVEGSDSVATILERTEAEWRQAGHAVRRGTAGGWQVLSAMGEQCLVTLQLAPRNGSYGYLALGTPLTLAAPSAASMGVPLPPGATLASSVASDDDGRKGLVVTASSPQSMDTLNRYFVEQLSGNKWSTPRSHKVINRKTGVNTLFLSASRDRKQVEIVMWAERGTQIVMTVSEPL